MAIAGFAFDGGRLERAFGWLGLALALAGSQALAATSCPPEGWSRDDLQTLKAGDFKVQTDDRRARLALDLLDCLASPDPALRDGIAF